MDLLSLIISVNKVALVAFIITFILTVYELILMMRERMKQKKISVPDFKEEQNVEIKSASIKQQKPQELKKPFDRRIFMALLIFLVVFGIIAVLGVSLSKGKNTSQSQQSNKAVITYVESDGIKIYDENWNEFVGENNSPVPGNIIYIGVVTIENTDINKARIRINSNTWSLDDETSDFNKTYKVFYRKYKIPLDEFSIQVEAHLYSAKDGWLGE